MTAIKKMLALLLFTTALGIGITYFALMSAGKSRNDNSEQIYIEEANDTKP